MKKMRVSHKAVLLVSIVLLASIGGYAFYENSVRTVGTVLSVVVFGSGSTSPEGVVNCGSGSSVAISIASGTLVCWNLDGGQNTTNTPIIVLMDIDHVVTVYFTGSSPPPSGTQWCINFNSFYWTESNFKSLAQGSGTKWARMDAYDISASGGTYANMIGMHNLGIKVILIVDYGFSTTSLGSWQADVHTAFQNYGSIPDAIECWNEPDITPFQRGFMDGSTQVYFDALKVVHDEMVTAGMWGHIPLVAGAVSNAAPQNNGGKLLAAIHQLGSDSFCDVYSYHSYAGTIHDICGSYDAGAAYQKIKSLYSQNKPLWITEMGDGATNPPYMQSWLTELKNVGCPFVCWYHFSSSSDVYSMVHRTGTNVYNVQPQYNIFKSFAGA